VTDRKTASTINDSELDALYDDLDRYEEVVGELNEKNISLARQANPALHDQLTAAISALGKAETELAALRDTSRQREQQLVDAHQATIGDLRAAETRTRHAEAAIERVRRLAGWALNGWSDLSPRKILDALDHAATDEQEQR
jgi:hypothetical protein